MDLSDNHMMAAVHLHYLLFYCILHVLSHCVVIRFFQYPSFPSIVGDNARDLKGSDDDCHGV